ncbi:MAG: hypothetical protein HW421_3125 [Ignavibacteria bacterium]|nr:hypothetical protein [Ignavibacteria bacterium]
MKKFVLLIVIALLALVGSYETQAQPPENCPNGQANYNTFTITINNCEYEVGICWDCNVTGVSRIEVRYFTLVDPDCDDIEGLNSTQVLERIYSIVYTNNFISTNLCNFAQYTIPPCEQGEIWFDLIYSTCWSKNLYQGHVYVTPCHLLPGYCYCIEAWKVCFDVQNGTYRWEMVWNDYSCTMEACGPVPSTEPPDPTDPQNPYTDCWTVPTSCTP